MDICLDIINKYSKNKISKKEWLDIKNIYDILQGIFGDILTNNQYNALTSFAYSIGIEEFLNTEIPALILQKEFILVKRIMRTFNRHGRVASVDLVARREDEIKLFIGEVNV